MLFWLVLATNLVIFTNCVDQYGENSNSCIDSCSDGFSLKYRINLDSGNYELKDNELVEVLEDVRLDEHPNVECSKNVLLRIPFLKLVSGTIVKLELEYGDLAKGTTFHIGNSPTNDLFGGDQNSTMFNSEIYANEANLSYYMSSLNLCEQNVDQQDISVDLSKILLLNESLGFVSPKSKLTIYISEKWFRIDSLEKNASFYYSNDFLFSFRKSKLSEKCENNSFYNHKVSPFLYIGLNRVIADSKLEPGSGLCNADISFLNCFTNSEPDVDVNVAEMKYNIQDSETVAWVNLLSYLEPSTMEHSPCSGQGVLKLRFDPKSEKKVARFDLDFGEVLSGFTFNIGDSPTNNAYGGDSGTTSNSAEIHSNDNRFYVWLNTKYCGDTLLHKIEYNLFQSYDKLTMFISDQRIEITNHKGYHEILKNPYLYNLNGQNVTCNCFDTRCYSGVAPDDELYFGINRVVGGTYRPGVGLCNAKMSWLQCKTDVKSYVKVEPDFEYVDWFNRPMFNKLVDLFQTTTIPTTLTSINELFEETTMVFDSTINILDVLRNSSIEMTKEKDSLTQVELTENIAVVQEEINDTQNSTQEMSVEETTLNPEVEKISVETTTENTVEVSATVGNVKKESTNLEIVEQTSVNQTTVEHTSTAQATEEQKTEVVEREEEEIKQRFFARMIKSNLGRFDKGRPLMLSHNVTLLEGPVSLDVVEAVQIPNETEEIIENPCSEESIQKGLDYHEFKQDITKFILCEDVNKFKILSCPLNMKWSQSFLQCLDEK